jgi:glycosyltransferase involved in cell wall biosynthesis
VAYLHHYNTVDNRRDCISLRASRGIACRQIHFAHAGSNDRRSSSFSGCAKDLSDTDSLRDCDYTVVASTRSGAIEGAKKTILYFYLHGESERLLCNPFEYRFLEVLSRNYEVVVAFFTRFSNHKPEPNLAPKGVKFNPIRAFPTTHLPTVMRWPFETIIRALIVALIIRALRPSVVFGNWITRSSGLYCALAGFHPLIVAAWGSDVLIEAKKSRILRTLGKFTVRAADAVIVDSEVKRRAVLDLDCTPSKIYSFPWGIDLDKFRPKKLERAVRHKHRFRKNRIVVSTRMHFPIYGVEYFIRAIPVVLSEMQDVEFLVAGDGPLHEYYTSLARKLGIEQHVRFTGAIPNDLMPDLLNEADVYVSASLSDGASASLMEALACGLPVVVTKIPGNKEWVRNEENGLLVPPRDSEALARQITRILRDEQLMSDMREANLKVARERADWRENSLMLENCVSKLASMAGISRGD